MTAISDAVVIGVVLGLVFAAVGYYLYSRQTQLERKISLMENILLELKVTTEQTLLSSTSTNYEDDSSEQTQDQPQAPPQIHNQNEEVMDSGKNVETREIIVEQPPRTQTEKAVSVSTNYESMTYKELLQIARQRGIPGLRTMSKAQVIEALRNNDNPGAATIPLSSWSSTPIDQLASAQDGTNSILATLDLDSEIEAPEAPEASLVSSD